MSLHPKAKEFAKSGLFAGVKSFADLEKRIAAIPENKGKGDAFEQLVKAFLLLDPEYATKISEVWIHHEVPPAIRKKLHLPDSDQGIDLIAKTKAGEFWAIQCKYRTDSTRPIPWKEISTFTGLAFGVCKGISFGLICSTTERITKVVGKQERIGFCALDVWQGLDAEFFARLRASIERKATKPKPLSPLSPSGRRCSRCEEALHHGKEEAGQTHHAVRHGQKPHRLLDCQRTRLAQDRDRSAEPCPDSPDAEGLAPRGDGLRKRGRVDLRLQ